MNAHNPARDATASPMTCLEFRRLKLADPHRLSAAALAHQRDCVLCQAFARRVDVQEQRIGAVLDIPVPDGLADRVLVRIHHGRPRPWRLLALAATVVLSVGLSFSLWHDYPRDDYARFAIEHTLHEPESFTDHRLADPSQFRLALARFGAELEAPVGEVLYMKLCPVPGGTGWHIVIRTEHGPATLLLIPRKAGTANTPGAPLEAEWRGLTALAEPGGEGYYAIVADTPERAQAIAAMMKERIRWRI